MPMSVCIPTFNPGPFLAEAIHSVLSQAGVDLELAVIDDASLPPIGPQVEAIQDSRLRYECNYRNLGLVGNWNRCLKCSTGDPVLLFHQDDRLRPGYLARALAMLERHPEAGFVFCNVVSINARGQELGGHWSPQALPVGDEVLPGRELIRRLLTHGNFVPCQTVVVRATAYTHAGLFDSRLEFTPDLEMWLRLASSWDAVYLADPQVEIRRHEGQESNRFLGSTREIAEVRRAFLTALSRMDSHESAPNRLPREISHQLAQRHLQSITMSGFRRAVRSGQIARAVDYAVTFVRMKAAILNGSSC